MRTHKAAVFGIYQRKSENGIIKGENADNVQHNQYARFLGYDVRVRREQKLKPSGDRLMRTLNNKVELNVPFSDKIMPFLFEKAIIKQTHDGKIEHIARKYIYRCTDLEIIDAYNSEFRGICNYYGIASNFTRLDYFVYLMEYSGLKTLAGKHKSTSRKMVKSIQSAAVFGAYHTKTQRVSNIGLSLNILIVKILTVSMM